MVEEETPDGQLSMSEIMENKGTKRYCHIFADVARVEDMDTNIQKP